MDGGLLEETDLLVAGHHGSALSTSQAFLDFVDPEAVILSCGAQNPYGHPSRAVMHRLRDVPIYRTDRQGDLVIHAVKGQWYGPEPCGDYSPGGAGQEEAEAAEAVEETEEPEGDVGMARIVIPDPGPAKPLLTIAP